MSPYISTIQKGDITLTENQYFKFWIGGIYLCVSGYCKTTPRNNQNLTSSNDWNYCRTNYIMAFALVCLQKTSFRFRVSSDKKQNDQFDTGTFDSCFLLHFMATNDNCIYQ